MEQLAMNRLAIDHPKFREFPYCLCGQPKTSGLVLCWECHHKEKQLNDGGYSKETDALLNSMEEML